MRHNHQATATIAELTRLMLPPWPRYSFMRLKIKRLNIGWPARAATAGAAGSTWRLGTWRSPRGHPIGDGLVIAVPNGYFLGVFARSSTPLKRGLMVANGVGVVDADYCGPDDEIKVQVLNITDQPVVVKKGERIAQGIVLPAPEVRWEEVDEMSTPTRGGFGSTG
jgi:dUTP pyrophosphatase